MLDKLNEEDKKKVIDKLNTYGYKNANDSFFETKDYENLRDTMFHELPSMPKLRSLRLYSIDSLLNFGKNFALDHTNNECSTKIKFNNNFIVNTKLIKKYGLNISENEYINVINDTNKYLDEKDIFDKEIVRYDLYAKKNTDYIYIDNLYSNLNEKFYKLLPIIISYIKLAGVCDDNLMVTYIHEMYHGLLYKNKGYTDNLLLEEMIPIFMEKVSAYELGEDILEKEDLFRLFETKKPLLGFEKAKKEKKINYGTMESETYIYSSMLADYLFNIYKTGNNNIKKEINSDVNKIIDGKQKIEDILYKYDITEENSSKKLSSSAKLYTKVFYR